MRAATSAIAAPSRAAGRAHPKGGAKPCATASAVRRGGALATMSIDACGRTSLAGGGARRQPPSRRLLSLVSDGGEAIQDGGEPARPRGG